jgi:hypothetical protein
MRAPASAATVRLASDDQRDTALGDAGFLERNGRQRIAEMLLVVHGDRGDRGDRRRQHVGGVEPAAQSHFDDGGLHAATLEDLERHGRRHLEEGRRRLEDARRLQAVGNIEDVRGHRLERLSVDWHAVDGHALFDAIEMG